MSIPHKPYSHYYHQGIVNLARTSFQNLSLHQGINTAPFSNGYRYGFNGKEQDPEWNGTGNMYDYGFRIYDPRIAKFLSVDPLTASYPWYTPYQFAGNQPVWAIDLDGLEQYIVIYHYDINGDRTKISVYTIRDFDGKLLDQGIHKEYLLFGQYFRRRVTKKKVLLIKEYEGKKKVKVRGKKELDIDEERISKNEPTDQQFNTHGFRGYNMHSLYGDGYNQSAYLSETFEGSPSFNINISFIGNENTIKDAGAANSDLQKIADYLNANKGQMIIVSGVTPAPEEEADDVRTYTIDRVEGEFTLERLVNSRGQIILDKLVDDYGVDPSQVKLGEPIYKDDYNDDSNYSAVGSFENK